MKSLAVFAFAVIACHMLYAQPNPDTLWTTLYGGNNIDYCHALGITSDGGSILAGETSSFGTFTEGAFLVRLNSAGRFLWAHTYGVVSATSTNRFADVQQTPDHGFIAAGNTNTGNFNEMYLVKTNEQGDTMWTRTFSDPTLAVDIVVSAVQATDDGYVIAGYASSFMPHVYVCLVKTNLNGDTLWTRFMRDREAIAYESVSDIAPTSDGGFILVGQRYTEIGGNIDALLMKLSATGAVEWTRSFGYDIGSEDMKSVEQTQDGGYILAGMSSSTPNSDADMYVVRTTSTGDTLWTHMIGTAGTETASAVHQTAGGFIVAGTETPLTGTGHYYLVKLNNEGTLMWTRIYFGNDSDILDDMQVTREGYYLLGGSSMLFGGANWDMYVVETGPEFIFATDQPTIFPADFALAAYPNPFNATATLSYSLARAGSVQLSLFNLTGERVAVLQDGAQPAGTYRVQWNGSGCASGIYFATLTTGSAVQTLKLVLLK